MKKAAIYIRSASIRGNDVNLSNQRAHAEAFAAARGWTVVNVFTDAGHSANRVDRPGLTALLAEARSGAFEVLVVEDLQRLARNPEVLAEILETTATAGVVVKAVSGTDHVPALTTLEWTQLAAAHWKHEDRIKRRRAAVARKAREARQ